MSEAPFEMLDCLQSELSEEEIMPSRRCPHCKAISTYDQVEAHLGSGNIGPLNLVSSGQRIRLDRCRNEDCRGGVAVVFDSEGKELEIFPALDEEPDELLPEAVRTAFRQALRSLNEGIWDGCVLMCRRALDEATAVLAAEVGEADRKGYANKVLYDRIEYLAANHIITRELGEWAHEGRLAGKLGAHGREQQKWNTERDATEIVEFAKWFFRYLFVLPKQLAERREQAKQKPDEPTPPERTGEADQETPEPAPGAQ